MKYISTKEMSREEWIDKRHESIGASEAGCFFGLNPWKTLVELYYEKIGETEGIPDNMNMRLGREIEPIIKKLFEEDTGLKVVNDNKIRVDPIHPFITTNLDGMVVGEKVPIEYKMMGVWDGEIPDYYFSQIQHQMMVTQSPYCYFVVLKVAQPRLLSIQKYNRDEQFITDLREREIKFWNENVLKRVPPEPEEVRDMKLLNPKSDDGSSTDLEDKDPVFDSIKHYIDMRNEIKGLKKKMDTLKLNVMSWMGDNESAMYLDRKIISWKSTKDYLEFDETGFSKDFPDIYKKYTRNKAGHRRFLIKDIIYEKK